tara:strand:- start:143 stop:475 length:333 start_codon:yes stop_codon:yes gene_type:complete
MKKDVLILLIVALITVFNPTLSYANEIKTSSKSTSHAQLEGWVRMSFEVTETGSTDNIQILDSSPAGKFDSEAIKALSKWKYKPKIVDGVAVRQTDLKVQLDFVLDEDEN